MGTGLIVLANGLLTLVGALSSPLVVLGFVMAVGLSWLSLIEIDELNRQSNKPQVGRH